MLSFSVLLAATASADPGDLALLDDPIGIGVIYSGPEPGSEQVLDAYWHTLLANGQNSYQLAAPWDTLAAPDGTPDLSALEPLLDTIELAGLSVFFTLQSVDTTTLRLPAVLLDPNDPRKLRPDLDFDSPEVIAHLWALLDELVPLLESKGCFAISLANEVDIWAMANPDEAVSLAAFAQLGRQRVHAHAPEMASGVTITRDVLHSPAVAGLMADASDVLMITYYPVAGTVFDPSVVDADLDAFGAIAGGKQILIQEFGAPSGPPPGTPSVIGASHELQRRWIAAMFREVRQRPDIRYISFLHLADWPAPVIDFFQDYYGSSDPGFVELLSTLGVHRADGTPKPGAGELLRQVRRTAHPFVLPPTGPRRAIRGR